MSDNRFKGQTVLVAWAESVSGPGWSNQPIWILLQDGDGKLRTDVIQPAEQTPGMLMIFHIANTVNREMTALAMKWVKEKTDG